MYGQFQDKRARVVNPHVMDLDNIWSKGLLMQVNSLVQAVALYDPNFLRYEVKSEIFFKVKTHKIALSADRAAYIMHYPRHHGGN